AVVCALEGGPHGPAFENLDVREAVGAAISHLLLPSQRLDEVLPFGSRVALDVDRQAERIIPGIVERVNSGPTVEGIVLAVCGSLESVGARTAGEDLDAGKRVGP